MPLFSDNFSGIMGKEGLQETDMTLLMWLLLFVLVIAAVAARIKRAARIVVFRHDPGQAQQDAGFGKQVHGFRSSNVEQMVSCVTCGVYVPASEAFFHRGKVYCCEEHSVKP